MLFSLGSSPEEQAIYEALGALLWLQQWHRVRIDRPGEDHDSGFISRRSPTYSWEVAVIECMLFILHNSTSCQCCQRVLAMCCSHPTFSTCSTFPIFPKFSSFFMIFPSHLLLFVFGSFHLSVSQCSARIMSGFVVDGDAVAAGAAGAAGQWKGVEFVKSLTTDLSILSFRCDSQAWAWCGRGCENWCRTLCAEQTADIQQF